MPRFSAGTRSTGPGSTTLPVGSIYATNPGGGRLREVGVYNTTNTAVAIKLVRLLSLGTPGASVPTAPQLEPLSAVCVAYDTHTVAPTLGLDLPYRAQLPPVVGAGMIWTFGSDGLVIQPSVSLGIGILVSTGTGQILDWYVAWDEGTDVPPAPTVSGEVDRRGVYIDPDSITEVSARLLSIDRTLNHILEALM